MATVDSAVQVRATTRSERMVRFVTRTPLHFVLIGDLAPLARSDRRSRAHVFPQAAGDRLERLVAFAHAVGLDAEEL